MTCRFSLEKMSDRVVAGGPRNGVRSVKFVVSTTSVLPSQRPRESPWSKRSFGPTCGLPSSGMIRDAVHQLVPDHHGLAGLENLQVVVVGGAEHRRPFVAPGNAAFAETAILRGVGGTPAPWRPRRVRPRAAAPRASTAGPSRRPDRKSATSAWPTRSSRSFPSARARCRSGCPPSTGCFPAAPASSGTRSPPLRSGIPCRRTPPDARAGVNVALVQ